MSGSQPIRGGCSPAAAYQCWRSSAVLPLALKTSLCRPHWNKWGKGKEWVGSPHWGRVINYTQVKYMSAALCSLINEGLLRLLRAQVKCWMRVKDAAAAVRRQLLRRRLDSELFGTLEWILCSGEQTLVWSPSCRFLRHRLWGKTSTHWTLKY